MTPEFEWDERLGIPIPRLSKEWREFTPAERSRMLHEWETIRGRIPERIMMLERKLIKLQESLSTEDSFAESCRLNSEISELASIVNDLNIWFRTHQDMEPGRLHR